MFTISHYYQFPFFSFFVSLALTHTHTTCTYAHNTHSPLSRQGLPPWLKPFQCFWLDLCQAETKMSFRKSDNRPHLHDSLSATLIFKRHSLHYTEKLLSPAWLTVWGDLISKTINSNTRKQHFYK